MIDSLDMLWWAHIVEDFCKRRRPQDDTGGIIAISMPYYIALPCSETRVAVWPSQLA